MQKDSKNSENNKRKPIVDVSTINSDDESQLRQLAIMHYLRKILEIIKEDKDRNNKWQKDAESHLGFVLSVVSLHMWEPRGIEKIAALLKPYAAQIMVDDSDEREEKRKKDLDRLKEELRDEILKINNDNTLNEKEKKDAMEAFINIKKTEYNVEISIPFIQNENNIVFDEIGDKKFDLLITHIAAEAVMSKNKNDKLTADILSRLLLVRNFGITAVMMQQLNEHRLFYDGLRQDIGNPQGMMKRLNESELLSDEKIKQNVQNLIQDSLNNKNLSDDSNPDSKK